MQLIQNILTNNPCYTANRKITVKGIMLHSVGCPQPSASVFVKLWNKSSYGSACVHGFIDANSGDIHQTLPWNHRGWHSGGAANNTHIGIEMCEPSSIKYTSGASFTCSNKAKAIQAAETTYKSAIELFAYLCNLYNLDPLADGVIISHSEGYKRKVASGHADPEHLWKGLGLPYTMDTFRQEVAKQMRITPVPPVQNTNNNNHTTAPKPNNNETSFTVRINTDALNIRKGPGTSYPIVGCIRDRGIYTIVKVVNNWGLLKSKAGYICLDYTKRL